MQGKKIYPYAEIRNFTVGRRTRSFQKENNKNGTFLSSSDDELHPNIRKFTWKISMPTSMRLCTVDVKNL